MKKNFEKEFSPENFPNNIPHDPYYIKKVSAQIDEFFLKYRISQKWAVFGVDYCNPRVGYPYPYG